MATGGGSRPLLRAQTAGRAQAEPSPLPTPRRPARPLHPAMPRRDPLPASSSQGNSTLGPMHAHFRQDRDWGGGAHCITGSLQTPPTTRPVYKHSCCHIFAMHPKATSSERRCKKKKKGRGGGGRWSRHLERTGRLVFETVNSLNPYCESFMQNISGLLTLGLVRPPQIEKERGEGRGKARATQIIIGIGTHKHTRTHAHKLQHTGLSIICILHHFCLPTSLRILL